MSLSSTTYTCRIMTMLNRIYSGVSELTLRDPFGTPQCLLVWLVVIPLSI